MKPKFINREFLIQIRVNEEEKQIFQEEAMKEGLTVSEFIRHKILTERRKRK